jgi:pimeloyl-ACP methyl ester carboxylesterase
VTEQLLARASDGEPLAYWVHGAAGGTPMLTAHGLVSSVHHWKFFIPHYSPARPVVAWEYRGHGGLAAPRDPSVSVGQFADDAHAVWRAANVEPAVVVGLSFGVQVALEVFRRHRDCVRALVLICGTAGHPLDRLTSSPRVRAAMIATLRAFGRRRGLGGRVLGLLRSTRGASLAREVAFLSGGAHREATPPDVLDGLFAHVGSLDPELVGNVFAAYLEHSAFDMLPAIDVPTLIIAADADRLTPVATAERMHRAIRNSRLVVFPGHSHLVQVEQPIAVHDAIDAFLVDHKL